MGLYGLSDGSARNDCIQGVNAVAKKVDTRRGLGELKTALKEKNPGRLYIFYGEEAFLLRHYLEQIKKVLLEPVTESFNYHRFNSESFDLQTFADAVENLPMMAERKLVQVDDLDIFKLPEGERDALGALLSDVPPYCTVVFTFQTVAWKPEKSSKSLFAAIEKCGITVEFARQEERELIGWVSRHFAAAGKKISNDLCAYLIDISGGTMTALNGEIEKICAYSEAGEIVKADIDAVTEPVLDAVVFQMTDFLGNREYGKALEKLSQLLKMQQEPIAILGAVGNHLRRIATARTLLDGGKGTGELMSLCAMSEYPAKKTMAAARRFSPAFCAKAAELVLETDYRMKTSFDDPQRLLETLILRLSQEANHG